MFGALPKLPQNGRGIGVSVFPRKPLFFAVLAIAISLLACKKPGITASASDPESSASGGGHPITKAPYSLDWLVENSPFVFVGRVTAIDVERDSRGLVVSHNRFEVKDTLIGARPQGVVTLTTFGGTIGNETFSASHTPEFVQGQTYVIFTDLARTTYDPITGDERGVFRIVNSEVYTLAGRAIVDIQDGKFHFGSTILEEYPGGPSHEAGLVGPSKAGEPTVGGGVVSTQQPIVSTARPMQLAEFSRLIVAAKR